MCRELFFFPNYQQPCVTQIPVSLLLLSPTAHNNTIWLLQAPSYLWLYPKTLKCHDELEKELLVILQFPV